MPLWLDLLCTPMAAPETRTLRRMRYIWQAMCLTCAVAIGFFSSIRHAVGRADRCGRPPDRHRGIHLPLPYAKAAGRSGLLR